jgi:hypothetical protein
VAEPHSTASVRPAKKRCIVQLPAPPLPPGFVPPPLDAFGFVMFYVLFVEIVLVALPRKIGNRILETLFPILRRYL